MKKYYIDYVIRYEVEETSEDKALELVKQNVSNISEDANVYEVHSSISKTGIVREAK